MKRCSDVFWPAAALAGILTGCLSAPKPADTMTPWAPPPQARRPDKVWSGVRGQPVDLAKPLALAELADMAMRNNPATSKAWNDALAAAAMVDQAQGYFLPALTATLGGDRRGLSAEPDSYDMGYLRYGPGLQVHYLILNLGGGRQAAVEQAMQTVYAADFAFNRSIQDVLLAVETAYYGLVSAQAGVESAEANVKDAKTVMEAARQRLASDVGTELDVLQSQASYDQSLYNLAGAQGLLKTARGRLAQALGLPADSAIQVAPPARDVPDAPAPRDMQRLIDDSLDRRPDIAALRATVAAREASVKVVGSSRWPSLYLTGDLSHDTYDIMAGNQFPDRDWSYGVGLSLQWLLFDGFQTLSAKHAAAAQAESAKSQLRQAELAASADVWTRYHDYETAIEKVRFSAAYLKSASAAHDLALDSYKAGLKSILDLLDAESRLAQARSQSITAKQEAFTAMAGLAYATGLLEKSGSAQTQDLFSISAGKDYQP